ncbi:1-alkyl-2-acetylglycerophosphocholine esterase [Durusdinium trenchii]|uniref:1-alkyl-2-acetylglycerophosphocholine esterase n=1 Tax=Durusdinium trenchii TaxID=1381693 RepID=A0ABP0HJ12_9DINO
MATAGQPITYTAEVIGGAGSLCPALVGNPTLRRLGASILTDWFENGDGMLVLNTKDAMDAEVNHVKFFRILLTDSGHYILPCDNVQNEKVPRASKHEAIAFFQKITEITSKVWPDVQPRVRHCFHSQTAAEDDRCDYNREHGRDKGPMKRQDHDVGCDHLACENGEEDELRNPVPSRKIHFIDEEQQKKSEEPYDLMNSEKNKSLSPIAEERDSEDEVSPSAILAEQCMKNDKSKEPAKNSNHLINEHPAGPAILAPAIHDEQGLREASYDEEKNVFLSYTGDMIPETADQAKLKKRYKAIPEEFYTKSGLTPVTPKNFDSWFKRVRGRGLRWHFWELFSGSGRLSLTLLLAGLMVGFPVDYRYGWDMRVASHRGMIHAAYEEFQPGVLHMSPDCAPWSVAASTKDPDEKMCERLQDRPALQLCQDLSARQDANGRGYNIEQPYGAQSWQELPENPLRLQRIPGNKSRQRVDQCMHGAQDEHGYPIMKPTGFGSNIRWKHTGLRCGGHCGVPHTQLKGTGPSGLTRTSMSAVYPKGMCQRMKQDIIQYLAYMNLLKLKTWPHDAYAVTLGHYYDCVRCQLGRHCPRNIEHTLVPGQCRHGRWPSEENPRRKKKLETEMDAMKKWKQEAEAELYEGVEIKNLTSKALSVPTTHMLKKLLLETINATMGVFNEAARRKIDYVHWLDNPMLMSLFKEFFKDLIQVKGVKIELRPFHLASAEPKLPLTSSYLRMQVRGNVKAWDIHPPENLREMSFSQINAALDEDDWAITIYGVEHDMAPSPSTPASRPRARPDEPGIVQPAQVVLDRPGDPAERDPTQIAPYEDEELQTKSFEEIKPLKPNYNLRRVKLMRFVESLTEYKTNIYGWLKRNGKWRFFPREDDHATKIMLWVQHIYKGLSKHQVHGALLGRSLRNIKPPSNTVGHLISWIHGGQGYAVQEHFSDGFLKMKRVSNYSRKEMCTIYLFHYHPDPVEEPASQSTINKDDDKMDVNVPDDRGEKRDAPETRTVVMAPEKKRTAEIYQVDQETRNIEEADITDEEMILKAEKDESMVRTTHASVLVGLAAFATSKKMLAAMMPTLAFGTLVDAQSTEPENQEQKSYFSVYLMIFITVILAVMLERMVTSWMSKKRRIQHVKIESDDDDDMDVDQEGDQPSSSGASFQRKRKASPRDTWEDLARKVIDEKETLKRKNKKSEEDAHLQQQEIDSLKFDNKWWKDKYEKLEEKYDDKDFELKNLKNDMTAVNARKMVLESTVSDMRAGLVKLEDENAELKMKLDRKTAASSERPAPLTPRITDNAEMAGEIEKLQKMVKFKDQEIMRHLARIKSLEMPETIFITKTGTECPHDIDIAHWEQVDRALTVLADVTLAGHKQECQALASELRCHMLSLAQNDRLWQLHLGRAEQEAESCRAESVNLTHQLDQVLGDLNAALAERESIAGELETVTNELSQHQEARLLMEREFEELSAEEDELAKQVQESNVHALHADERSQKGKGLFVQAARTAETHQRAHRQPLTVSASRTMAAALRASEPGTCAPKPAACTPDLDPCGLRAQEPGWCEPEHVKEDPAKATPEHSEADVSTDEVKPRSVETPPQAIGWNEVQKEPAEARSEGVQTDINLDAVETTFAETTPQEELGEGTPTQVEADDTEKLGSWFEESTSKEEPAEARSEGVQADINLDAVETTSAETTPQEELGEGTPTQVEADDTEKVGSWFEESTSKEEPAEARSEGVQADINLDAVETTSAETMPQEELGEGTPTQVEADDTEKVGSWFEESTSKEEPAEARSEGVQADINLDAVETTSAETTPQEELGEGTPTQVEAGQLG